MRRQRGWRRIGGQLFALVLVTGCGGTPPAPTFMLAPVGATGGQGPAATAAAGSSASAPGSGAPGSVQPASVAPSATPSASPAGAASPSTSSGVSPYPSVLAEGPVIAVPGLGLSLRLPSGWVGIDSTVPPSLVDSTVARHPDLAESLAKLRSGELGFVAFDPASTASTTARISIATTGDAIPMIPLLESLAWHTADQLTKTASISDLEVTPATLAAGPAVELRYRLRPTSGADFAVDSWFISAGGHTFLLTFTGPVAEGDQWQPKVRAIADSLSAR